MSSDHSVPRNYADVFHDVVQLGNRIRNRLASWKNIFMTLEEREIRMQQAKQLLLSLKEELDKLKLTLWDEVDKIDFDWHMHRFKDLSAKFLLLESSTPPPTDITAIN